MQVTVADGALRVIIFINLKNICKSWNKRYFFCSELCDQNASVLCTQNHKEILYPYTKLIDTGFEKIQSLKYLF